VRPVAFVTRIQWHLDKVANKDALDGYDLHVHQQQFEVNSELHNTPWEQLVLMQYQRTTTPADVTWTIRSIKDGNGKALAIQMLLSLLRTRELPPHPFRPPNTISSSLVSVPEPPTVTTGAIPVPKVHAASTPLSPADRASQEAAWRAQIETIRTSLVATLDEITPLASTLDASPLTAAVHLALAENYLLEQQKASIALEHAADNLNRAYQNEHGSTAVIWKWWRDNIPSALLAVLVYVLALNHELFKKLTEHYASHVLLKRWPDKELAAAVGKAIPSSPILVPNGSVNTPK
jgi:hypothetical protein